MSFRALAIGRAKEAAFDVAIFAAALRESIV
jgi:hypothetical protein